MLLSPFRCLYLAKCLPSPPPPKLFPASLLVIFFLWLVIVLIALRSQMVLGELAVDVVPALLIPSC